MFVNGAGKPDVFFEAAWFSPAPIIVYLSMNRSGHQYNYFDTRS